MSSDAPSRSRWGRREAAAFAGLLLLGCGPTAPAQPDARAFARAPDAGAGGSPSPGGADAGTQGGSEEENLPPAECPESLQESYGDLGAMDGTKNAISGGPTVYIDVDGDGEFGEGVSLVVQTVPGRGVFQDGLVPGTYPLEGPDTDYQRCSMCVFMFADYASGPPSMHLMASQGTVVIDSVTEEEISGSLDGVVLRPIEIVYDGETCGDIEDPVCGNTICLGNECGRQQLLDACGSSIEKMQF